MKKQTLHLGLRGKGSLYGHVFHACNGRASRDLLSVTDDVAEVTCRRCLKGPAVRDPPKRHDTFGVWHIVSDAVGCILGVYGEALIAEALALAKDVSAQVAQVAPSADNRIYVHHVRGERPAVGESISMNGADTTCDVVAVPAGEAVP